ncbi:MAG: ParB N-terminal domain-containing protein, partial [Paracoccaceae bacterium]
MPNTVHQIPLDQIDAAALPRDRTTTGPAALAELTDSIARHGLRQPIELFATDDGYALISGHRRLQAVRQLALARPDDHTTIPAFLRDPATLAEALAAMVEENDIRADISPWEQGQIIVTAWADRHFDTLDAAVDGLYPSAARQRKARLRDMARVVTDLDGHLATPEQLNQRQMLRLAAACRGGFTDLMHHALTQSHAESLPRQWQLLDAVLNES